MKSWSRQLLIVLLVLFALVWVGCSKDSQEQEKHPEGLPSQPITVVETNRSLQNAPLYTALEKGFLSKEKLNINLVTQSDFMQAAGDLRSGKIQFLITTSDKILYLCQQELRDFRLIGELSTSGSYHLLTRKAGPFTWEDMKGKVILGYQGGDLPFTLLYSQLRSQNLRPFSSVHPVENLAYAHIPAAYRAGSGHYLVAEEPLVSMLESEGIGQIITSVKFSVPDLPAYTVMVNKSFLENNKATCRSFLRSLAQSLAWLDQEAPAEIATTVQSYFPEYPEIVLQRAAGRYKNAHCWEGLQINVESFQTLQELMIAEKELRQLIPAQQLIDNSVLSEN